jgi:hypothetical protein
MIKMAYIKLDENDVVIYKTPYNELGTIEVSDDVVCGMVKSGDTYVIPPPTAAELKAKAEDDAKAAARASALAKLADLGLTAEEIAAL